jgi:hypothetical protein
VLDEVEENLILEMENIRLWQYRFKMAIEQASTRLRTSGEYRRCIWTKKRAMNGMRNDYVLYFSEEHV